MAVSLMQRIRLALRGWVRRREVAATNRKSDFMQRNAGWSAPTETLQTPKPEPSRSAVDLEGLQVAYLDDSGRIEHYLDTVSGDVIDIPASDPAACKAARQNVLYRRVPARSAASEAADRTAFVEAMEPGRLRGELERSLSADDPAGEFRKLLAGDRAAERAWYNFKNDRAIAAIEEWLHAG